MPEGSKRWAMLAYWGNGRSAWPTLPENPGKGALIPAATAGGGIVGLGQQRSVSGEVTDRKLILVIVVAGKVISLVSHVRGLDKEAGGKVTLNSKRPLLNIGVMACSPVPKQRGAAIDEIGIGAG